MKNKKSKKIDPKYINVPNICFSLTKSDDKREKKFKKQRIKRGFDESETYSLCDTIARFSIPRLQEFIEIYEACNMDTETRDEFIKKSKMLLDAFELITRAEGNRIWTPEEETRVEEGLAVFPDIFLGLWW